MGSSDSARSEEPSRSVDIMVLATVSSSYPLIGQIPLHYSPVRLVSKKVSFLLLPLDLHVLGLPPASSIWSHDQTFQLKVFDAQRNRKLSLFII